MACLTVLLALAGCTGQRGIGQVGGELSAVQAQVNELRNTQEMTSRELGRIVAELNELDGRRSRSPQQESGVTPQVARLEARLQETEGLLTGLRSAVENLGRQVARLSPPAYGPEQPLKRGGSTPESPEQIYAAALRSFRARELGQAVLEFLDFIARFPKHPLAGQAQFWVAEAYYTQRDYRQALAEFQKAAELYGEGVKVPDALLRVGLCYLALRDPDRARDVWQQLVQDHAGSEAAREAQALLREPTSSARLPR